jgi:hypothetical protein
MPWATDLAAIEPPGGQGGSHVWAEIVDRLQLASDPKYCHHPAVHGNCNSDTLGEIFTGPDVNQLTHLSPS